MRFADPQSCPDCRGVIAGQPACPHCGLDLTSVEVRQLWQTLLQADDLLARAVLRRVVPAAPPATAADSPVEAAAASSTVPPPTAAPGDDPFRVAAPEWRPYPVPEAAAPAPWVGPTATPQPPSGAVPAPRPGRSWSAGTVLLVLGAFGLIAAGLIFVTRSWDDIGLTGKTLILLGVTFVMGTLGVWVTRRPLRASAEAVWSVFLALLTLDFFAGRQEDLAGLGSLSLEVGWVVWGVVALALSVSIALWARPHVGAALVAPAVVAGLAIAMSGIGSGALGDDWDVAWRALVALVVAGLLALSTRPARLAPTTLAARIVIAGFFAVAYAAALSAVVLSPSLDDLVGGGEGGPLLLMGVAAVVIAWLVGVVRVPSVALAVLAASALVLAPAAAAGGEDATWAVVAVVAVVLAVVGSLGGGDWIRGVRLGAVPAVTGIVVVHLRLAGDVVETLGRFVDDPWRADWDRRLDVTAVGDHAAWVVPTVLAGLVAAVWFVCRWPELSAARRHTPAVVTTVVAFGAVDSVVALRWPIWLVALTLVVLAVSLVGLRIRAIVSTPSAVAGVLVLAAAALASASHGVSAATWLLGGSVLLVVALVSTGARLRHVHAVAGVSLVLAGTAALVELLDVTAAATSLVVVVAALALMAGAQLASGVRPVALAVESAAATGLVIALVMPGSSGDIAVRWTVAGVTLIVLGLAVATRRWLAWPGIAALVVAYVALIIDSGFSFVEAYTLPLGAAGLAAGLVMTPRKPEIGTWTLLGPGLAVALLPSVPQALAEPTELRALVLGAGALAALAVGVRLGWQAPFVAGVAIVTLLIVFNIGPYANAAPRVVLIAALGAISMGLGITWEDRVRDGRKLVAYVRSMR